MMKYLAEFIGTMMLILFNNGVVANIKLNRSHMKDAGTLQLCIASGLAVFIPVCIFSSYSGAHFNPAVTLGFALTGQFPLSEVPVYILSQFAGLLQGPVLSICFLEINLVQQMIKK